MTRRRREEELDRDIREHLEMEIQDNLDRGMPPEAARAAALRKFGNVARIKEDTRAVWGWTRLEQILQDIRYALRMLRKNPGFATVAIVTLALGIGMNTAVFSVVNAVLLKPLPYPNAERLVWLANYNERFKSEMVSGYDFFDWKRLSKSFDRMACYGYNDMALASGGEVDQVAVAVISDDFLAITGARPALGRLFALGERNAVLLTDRLFERRFGRDPGIVGKTVTLNGKQAIVAGVLPSEFRFVLPLQLIGGDPKEIELYVPTTITPQNQIRSGANTLVHVVASLRPGVPLERARAELEAIQADITKEDVYVSYGHVILRVVPMQEKLVGKARPALTILMTAVGFVLIIACVNIANLLLARATSRRKEIAIRAAVGAGRKRMAWQFVAEGLVLAVCGGAAGVLLARWGVALIIRLAPNAVPRLVETSVDGRVLAFSLALSIATGVLFGLAPAVPFYRTSLTDVLKESAKTPASGSGLGMRRLLVAGELAAALVLLIGAGLLVKSFWRMSARPPGFDPQKILVMKVSLSGPQYREMPQQLAYFQQALDRLAGAPGVQAAGLIFSPVRGFVDLEGPHPWPPDQRPGAIYYSTSAGYFPAMGIRLLAGRWMSDDEPTEVVLVNEAFARRVLGNSDPLGRRIRLDRPNLPPSSAIVGVVSDVKYSKLDAEPGPEVYFPYRQSPYVRAHDVVVKASVDPSAIAPAVRKLLANIDRTQSVYGQQTLDRALADSIAPRRFNLMLLGAFASVALLLAIVGIYGVMSYMVTQRTREIGVRMALGARQGEVLRMVVRQGMWVAAAGILCGVGAALALTRLMGSLLYEVTATDPYTFAVVCLALGAAALVACCVPAVKAARVDPIVALRYE